MCSRPVVEFDFQREIYKATKTVNTHLKCNNELDTVRFFFFKKKPDLWAELFPILEKNPS